MIDIYINRKKSKLKLKEKFEELTQREFILVAEAMHLPKQTLLELDTRLVYALLYCKSWWKRNIFLYITASPLMIRDLHPGVSWIQKLTVTEDKLKYLKVPVRWFKKVKYYSPASFLLTFKFREFIESEKHFINYAESKDIQDLNRLLAVIYRPAQKILSEKDIHFKGDHREPFNEYNIEARAKLINKVSYGEKMAALMFYTGCRQKIISEHQNIFKKSEDQTGDSKNGLAKLLLSLSGNKFGTVEQTGKEELFTVLFEVDKSISERKEQERKAKQKR